MLKRITLTTPLKILISILILTIATSAALILSLGVGGNLVEDYRKTLWTVTTQGTADSLKESDPHIVKVDKEYRDYVKQTQKQSSLEGIYERIHAGDYSYENINDPANNGQYVIENFTFFKDLKEAEESFNQIKEELKQAGYAPKNNTTWDSQQLELVRQFIPAREQSLASPGNDEIILILSQNNNVAKIMFNYTSTELPLNKIPTNGDKNYTVSEWNHLWEQVTNKELNLCDYKPNGAIGGWYPEYKCLQKQL